MTNYELKSKILKEIEIRKSDTGYLGKSDREKAADIIAISNLYLALVELEKLDN